MKRVIKGFITFRPAGRYYAKPDIDFYTFDPRKIDGDHYKDIVVVRAHEFEIEVPDNYDPREQMLANLRAAKEKARADFAAKVTEYDRQINELLAIENAA